MILPSPARLAPVALLLVLAVACGCDRNPASLAEHLRRGDAALAEGRYGLALSAYGHARELAPQDASVQRALMRTRVHALAENAARVNPDGIDEAWYESQLLLDTDPGHEATYLTALANLLTRRGDVDGAKVKLAEALKADKASVLAHTALGLALMTRKEGRAEAKAELEQALKTKPDHAPALGALGQLALAQGDLTAAGDRFEAALRTGDDYGTRMALGSVRAQQEKPAEAVPHFERAAQLDSRSADALGSLGQALLGAGRAEEAERALRAAAQLRQDETVAIALGFSLARQNKPEQALGVFGQVLAQDGTSAPALYGAAVANQALGKTEPAVESYRRLLALPAEGPQQKVVADLQRDARARVAAMGSAAPAAGPWAPPSAAPSSSSSTSPRR